MTVNPETVAVESISLSESSFSLEEDEIATLTATVTPYTATDKTVTWESSAPEYVSVTPIQDENGKATITALKTTNTENPVTITAKAGDKTATCTVTVTAKTVPVESVTITGNGVTDKKATMTAGGELQLTATVEPDNATNSDVTWSSNNTGVATVSENGLVTAVGGGTATITATAGEQSAECQITVNVLVRGVTITAPEGTQGGTTESPAALNVDGTLQLTATVTPPNATNNTVTWSSNTPTVATVDSSTGLVTAVSAGSATITAKVDETHSATFQITVQAATTTTPGEGGTKTGGDQNGNTQPGTPGTGEGNGTKTGETTPTTQATNNAIVVSR